MNKVKLPDGIKIESLRSNYSVAATEYYKALRRAAKLDAVDQTELWSAIGSKYPSYQILPDTNHVSYIKNNIMASIYTVGKSANLIATSEADKDAVTNINVALENIWAQLEVNMFQLKAGERAALLNLGVTQVGWDNSIISGKNADTFYKGQVKLKNVNPLHYMRDPYATCLDTAAYVVVWDKFHKSVIASNPGYAAAFKEYLTGSAGNIDGTAGQVPIARSDKMSQESDNKADYYTIYTHWVRVENQIHEIHLLNNEFPLMVKENIKPSMFPFSELYCNLPNGNLLGISEPAKVFANSLAYNLMSSIILTTEYKNQRPPRFVSGGSGLNVSTFAAHGNDADRTFVVQGDASKAVHYQQFPQPSMQAMSAMSVLSNDVKTITGVDDRYTGRDTGSILTTGGIENMLAQVTMIDAVKILLYENYSKRLTQLIIGNLVQFSVTPRKYLVKSKDGKTYNSVEVDFPNIDGDAIFNYEIAISSELPKNKAVIQNMANKLMEMQMQYGSSGMSADLITPQEWLMLQDLPMREYWLERMNIQRTASWTEQVAQVISQYTDLVESGVAPEDAMYATAETMQAQATPGGGVQDVADNIQQGGNMMLTNQPPRGTM